MGDKLLSRNLYKSYSKYCYPIIFFVIVLIATLMLSYNNLVGQILVTIGNPTANQVFDLNYTFIGGQLLNLLTFILACVVPIIIALIMNTYEKNNKATDKELSAQYNDILTSKLISGALFIVLPFLANVLLYIVLVWANFFGPHQSEMLSALILTTIFGLAMALLTFTLLIIINMAFKNPVIDSLLTLAIALIVMEMFYHLTISPVFLIVIIVFVWLALVYLGYSIGKKKQ